MAPPWAIRGAVLPPPGGRIGQLPEPEQLRSLQKTLASTNAAAASERQLDELTRAAIGRAFTSDRMAALSRFIQRAWDEPEVVNNRGALGRVERLATAIEVLYFAMPRDFQLEPGAGQQISTRMSAEPRQFDPSPFFLTVEGTAQLAHTLRFRLADIGVAVPVPAGASPEATAQLIAQALANCSKEAVAKITFNAIGGNPGRYDVDELRGVSARADGDTVTIAPLLGWAT